MRHLTSANEIIKRGGSPGKLGPQRTTVKVRQGCGVIFFAATLCALGLAAQTRKTPSSAPRSPAQEPLIRVESNLVRVPVFVYFKYGLERASTEQESRCLADESSGFLVLSPQEPFLPRECDHREVKNLTLEDFRLFEEGEPQKIQSLERERWLLLIRDNRTWHNEISDTRNGVWSTTDLADSFQPWDDNRENYTLGFVPARSKEGCHQIRVEVRRPEARVLAREAYCAGQTPSDILNGTRAGEELQLDLAKDERAKLALFVQAGTFRGGTARPLVDVVLEFSWSQLSHYWEQQTGKIEANIGVLGAVYAKDGKLVTRFSDLLWPILARDNHRPRHPIRAGCAGSGWSRGFPVSMGCCVAADALRDAILLAPGRIRASSGAQRRKKVRASKSTASYRKLRRRFVRLRLRLLVQPLSRRPCRRR